MPETFDEHLIRIGAGIRAAKAEEAAQRDADALAGIAPPPEREYRYALRGEAARHGIGANGAPPDEPVTLKPGAALVLRIGEHLFGDRHTTDLGRVLVEDGGVVRRWRRGEGSGPSAQHTNFLRLELVRRIAKLQADLEALDEFREERGWATAPAPAPPQPAPEVILAPAVKPEDAAWFLDALARGDGGKPTLVRVFLSARRPPKGRHWTADIVACDGSRQTLHCDRSDDLQGKSVGFASATRERPEPFFYWDDQTGGWVRGPDWGSSAMKAMLAEETGIPVQGGRV